jgi:hypothetical protein
MGVLAVKEYKFRATAALDPAADNAAGAHLSRTRGHCVVEPAHRRYFPALISCDNQPPPLGGLNILVRIALTDTEADLFFPRGRRFTIWSDAIIGKTTRGEGLVGYGVISCRESPPSPSPDDSAAHRPRADPVPVVEKQ